MHARLAQAWRDQKDRLLEVARGLGPEPLVLASHVLVRAPDIGTGYGLSEHEDIPVEEGDLPLLDYVALGHVHKPQAIGGRRWARYSGAIERLDMGEAEHDRGVVLVDIGQQGLREDPAFLPLDPSPFYRVTVDGHADLGTARK
jgi:DNA repair exonuclease SbcCD nuclease subunit